MQPSLESLEFSKWDAAVVGAALAPDTSGEGLPVHVNTQSSETCFWEPGSDWLSFANKRFLTSH
jgi:hypothetical protein